MTPTIPGIQQMIRVARPYFQVDSDTREFGINWKMRLKPWRKSVTASPRLTSMSKKRTLITAKAARVSRKDVWSSESLYLLQLLASLTGRV